jgi:hypothetical protein
MNIALNSKIFSSCSEAFIEPQNPVEPGKLKQLIHAVKLAKTRNDVLNILDKTSVVV